MSRGIAVAAEGFRHRVRVLAAVCAIGALAACSQPPAPASGATDQWSGRLALQVEDAASQSFSAGFELQGRPERGQLTLLNPLGNVIATLEWEPGQAVLVSGQERRVSASLDALVRPVDHRLAVEADHVDVGGRQVVLCEEALHRLGMGRSDEALSLRQSARPVVRLDNGLGVLGGGAQERLLVVGIAAIAGGAERFEEVVVALHHADGFPVRLDERHVDTVERSNAATPFPIPPLHGPELGWLGPVQEEWPAAIGKTRAGSCQAFHVTGVPRRIEVLDLRFPR